MAGQDISSPETREQMLRSIRPENAKTHHPLLREIFRAEVAYRTADEDQEFFENIYWCAYLLFHVGDPADTSAMWQAKHLNMDVGCGFDVENMVGAGVEETIAYLRSKNLHQLADNIASYFSENSEQEIAAWSQGRYKYFYADQS
ncbi:hypothetical protein [Stenotrophomonas sp. PS02289]|uniref:hypothetical protein n=1 Tax=Stenotrophomonas sp. PS02289 TaxID=2991422 RepID=UPI00249B67F8|nr:hypothetical protein [Stenotrophomonas sp. PS02289]